MSNKPEWTIVPDDGIAIAISSAFKKGDKYTNLDLVKIAGKLYQKKLLEYLIAEASTACIGMSKEDNFIWGTSPKFLKQMLSELEKMK